MIDYNNILEVELSKQIDRTYVMNFVINNTTITPVIKFSKFNIKLEHSVHEYKEIENRNIAKIDIIRNLSKSIFVNKTLKLETEKTYRYLKNDDKYYVDKAYCVIDDNKLKQKYGLFKYFQENIDMASPHNSNKLGDPSKNYLRIIGYGLAKFNNDFLFLYVERGKYFDRYIDFNNFKNKTNIPNDCSVSVIRSSAIQIINPKIETEFNNFLNGV